MKITVNGKNPGPKEASMMATSDRLFLLMTRDHHAQLDTEKWMRAWRKIKLVYTK